MKTLPILCLILLAGPAVAGEYRNLPADPGGALEARIEGRVTTQDGTFQILRDRNPEIDVLVPDLGGNYIIIPDGPRPSPNPSAIAAQEIRLKARELAAQLLESWPNAALSGLVALPTTFVSQENFEVSSPLGRYLAEAMFHEFNMRGMGTREYRTDNIIHFEPGAGDLYLTRNISDRKVEGNWAAVLVGTYYRDREVIFVNARLIRASDGLVLRTGQVILPMNEILSRMSTTPPLPFQRPGHMQIVQGRK